MKGKHRKTPGSMNHKRRRNGVDARRYENLFDRTTGEYYCAGIGGMRARLIYAGDSLEVELFPVLRKYPQGAAREQRHRKTSAAQERVNCRKTEKRMRRLAEANFGPDDFAVHPTFDYGMIDRDRMSHDEAMATWEHYGLPTDEKAARRLLYNYIERIRTAVRRQGGDPSKVKYICVVESTHEPRDEDFRPLPAQYHYHIILHAPGLAREKVESLWPAGYCNCYRLDFSKNGLKGLTTYMSKQRRSSRRWSHSRNLVEPVVEEHDIKMSRKDAEKFVTECMNNGRRFMEEQFPGYQCIEDVETRFSDFVPGAFIFARLRRTQPATGTRRDGIAADRAAPRQHVKGADVCARRNMQVTTHAEGHARDGFAMP